MLAYWSSNYGNFSNPVSISHHVFFKFYSKSSNPMSVDHGGGNEYLDTVFPVFRLVLFSGQSQLISHFSAL
jgi:hypothetical protein